jgi:endo-1,4-beta-mannosidase
MAGAVTGPDDVNPQDYWLSLDRFVNWSSTAKGKDDFYTDWECRQLYKRHIEHYVNRRNTYNGRLYKEDPTIFYWNLMNEPRWCAWPAGDASWSDSREIFLLNIMCR